MPVQFRILVGIVTVLVSGALFVMAWLTFESGKPGAPPFPDARPDYGVDAGARVYLPADSGVTLVRWEAYYRAVGNETVQDITVTAFGDRDDSRSHLMILELREAAQLVPEDLPDSVQKPVGTRVATRGDGRQYVIADDGGPNRGGILTIQIRGRTQVPALITENSRTSFVSPDLGETGLCPLPATPQSVDIDVLGGPVESELRCESRGISGSVTMSVEGYQRSATRLDFSDPTPTSGGGTALRWVTTESTGDELLVGRNTDGPTDYPPQLRARASYVDIAGEAAAQRSLFASGVVIGIASALAPIGVQMLVGAARRRARPIAWGAQAFRQRAPGRADDETPEPPPST